jgi:hypothetical protein
MASAIRSAKIQDVRAVVLECKKCGATVGYLPCKWNTIPFMCVNCGVARMGDTDNDYRTLNGFRVALQNLCESSEGLPYHVKFEFNGDGELSREG